MPETAAFPVTLKSRRFTAHRLVAAADSTKMQVVKTSGDTCSITSHPTEQHDG